MKNKKNLALLIAIPVLLCSLTGSLPAYAEQIPEDEEALFTDVTSESEEESELPSIEEICLNKNSLNLESGASAALILYIEPEDANYGEPIWSSDNENVTLLPDGLFCTVKAAEDFEGTAEITCTLGDLSDTCTVYVSRPAPLLAALVFTGTAGTESDEFLLSDYHPADASYELMIPIDRESLYIHPHIRVGAEGTTLTASYVDRFGREIEKNIGTEGNGTPLSFLLEAGDPQEKEILLTAVCGERTETTRILVKRSVRLSSVKFTDEYGAELKTSPVFTPEGMYYELYVPQGSEKITADMTPLDALCSHYYLNGTEIEKVSEISLISDEEEEITGFSLSADDMDKVSGFCYQFLIVRTPVVSVSFELFPQDSVLAVYDAAGARLLPDAEGNFRMETGSSCSYFVSCPGYISQSAVILPDEDTVVHVGLSKIAETVSLPEAKAWWTGTYKDETNCTVAALSTPERAENTRLDWETETGSFGGIIILNDLLCTCTADSLVFIDPASGQIVKSERLAASGQLTMNNTPVYGGGMIFVPLSGGRIQAFSADELEPLWIFTAAENELVSGSMHYESGFLYAGFYAGGEKDAFLYCINTEIEFPGVRNSTKNCVWKKLMEGGCVSSPAASKDRYLYTVSYAGNLNVIEKSTGIVASSVKLTEWGGTSGAVVRCGDSFFFSTVKGYLVSFETDENGLIEESLTGLKLGAFSSCTPMIAGNRIYVGVSENSANVTYPDGRAPYYLFVVDTEGGVMSVSYRVELPGSISGAPSISRDAEGRNLVYYTIGNGTGSRVNILVDAEGQREPSSENGVLYISQESGQKTVGMVIIGENGQLYARRDNGVLFSLSKENLVIEEASVSDEAAYFDNGTPDPFKDTHTVTLSAKTKETTFTVKGPEGVDILIDGNPGCSAKLNVEEDGREVVVVLSDGVRSRSFSFTFVHARNSTALTRLYVTTGVTGLVESGTPFYTVEDLKDPDCTQYTILFDKSVKNRGLYIWAEADYGNAKIKLMPVSNSDTMKEIKPVIYNKKPYYSFTRRDASMPAVFDLFVTSADGRATGTYRVTMDFDTENPVIKAGDPAVTERTKDSAVLTVNASEACELYYLLFDSMPGSFPLLSDYSGKGEHVTEKLHPGENTLMLTGLPSENKLLFAAAIDGAHNWSSYAHPLIVQLGKYEEAFSETDGDVNMDGIVDIFDALAVVDIVNGVTEQYAENADVNNDGMVDIFDAIALTELINGVE